MNPLDEFEQHHGGSPGKRSRVEEWTPQHSPAMCWGDLLGAALSPAPCTLIMCLLLCNPEPFSGSLKCVSCFQGPTFKIKSHLQSSALDKNSILLFLKSEALMMSFCIFHYERLSKRFFLNDFLIAGNLLNHFLYRNCSSSCFVLVTTATKLGLSQLPACNGKSSGVYRTSVAFLALKWWAGPLHFQCLSISLLAFVPFVCSLRVWCSSSLNGVAD